jgi:excisionase family DNA binding protein
MDYIEIAEILALRGSQRAAAPDTARQQLSPRTQEASTVNPATVHPLTPRTAPIDAPDRGRPAPVGTLTYTVAEVANMLRLNLGGTYRMIRSGDIPAHKLGGRWVVPRRAFHTWLDSLQECSPEEATANRRAEIVDLTDEEKDIIWAYRNRPERHGA